MVSHAIVPFIEISTLFLLANLFLQYNIGAGVDDVATYTSQAQRIPLRRGNTCRVTLQGK